ncbi:MAG: ABC transporter permease [Anaerolineales bacterium]
MSEGTSETIKPEKLKARFSLPFASVGLPLLSVAIAMLIGAVIMRLMGFDPIQAYATLWQGSFGNLMQTSSTLTSAIPLLLCGLGIAFAFQAGAFNIGAVGQMYLGALGAILVAGQFPGLPGWLHMLLATLAAFIAGGIWAYIPAMIKIYYGANEIISTILLNYVGIYLVEYMISGPIRSGGHEGAPTSWPVVPNTMYPKLIPQTQLHLGLVIALVAMVIIYIVMRFTTLGQRVLIVGKNPVAARHAGIQANRIFVLTFFISGALAGLAGAGEILGYQTRLIADFAPNTGYDAIAVALLGGFQPFIVGMSALFFGGLQTGAIAMEAIVQMPAQLVDLVRVLAILAVLAASSPRIVQIAHRMQGEERKW